MTAEVLERIEVWGAAIADKLEQLAVDHGDRAVELALGAVRVDAGSQLAGGMISLIICVVMVFLYRRAYAKYVEGRGESDGLWIGMLTSGIVALGTFVVAVTELFNVWAWAGLIYPELWIAKKVIGL